MTEYLTEAGYRRWYRQYQINLGFYLDQLDRLRMRFDALPNAASLLEIEDLLNEIDKKLEDALPRDFSLNSEPLLGMEKFVENCKVLVNIIRKVCGKKDLFLGIYQKEKEKVLAVHQSYKFKDKIKELKNKIDGVEEQAERELEVQQSLSAG